MQDTYDVCYYDEDTGNLVGIEGKVGEAYKSVATDLWKDGYFVKVFDPQGAVVFTLG